MKLWLSYTFLPPDGSVPEYNGAQQPHEPVAVWWLPEIYSEQHSEKAGGYYDELPLPVCNVQEVWVESLRAYHLLCRRKEMKEFRGMVRILAPMPEQINKNTSEGVCVVASCREEYPFASAIASKFGGCVLPLNAAWLSGVFASCKTVVFPWIKSNTSAFLCAAVGEGCQVVASDAGAAEEYLTKYAKPGTWHICHRWKVEHFVGAINDLNGQPGWMQLPYCDDAPYE